MAETGDTYALSNDIAARIPGREGFALLDPATGRLATRRATTRCQAAREAATRHTGLLGAAMSPLDAWAPGDTALPPDVDPSTPTSSGWPWAGSPRGSPS